MKISGIFRFICFSVFMFYASGQMKSQSVEKADSLINLLEINQHDTATFNELNNIIGSMFYNDAAIAMHYSRNQLEIATKGNNHLETGKALLNMGICFDMQGKYDSSLYQYQEALNLAEKYQLQKLLGDIYNNFSITQAVLGNMEESISNALKALDVFEETKDSARMARIFNNLGARYSEMGYFDEALNYYQKAAAINKILKDNKKLAFNYGNIGLLYYDKGENEKALEFFQNSIYLQDSANDKYNYSIALHNLALVYFQMRNFDKALNYEEHAFAIATEINDELGKITSLNGIAAINNEKGERKEALKYFNQSAAIAERIGARFYLIKIYEKISDIYAEMDDYKNAFSYYKKYSALNDSVMTTEKDKAVQRVNDFEKEKRQQEIQLLTMNAELQKLNIKRQKTIRNSFAAVGILILLMAIGLLQRYRYVRKTRNELAEKNIIINKEKDRSDELLLNILPADTAEELKKTGRSEARHYDMATVMFMDIRGFTFIAEKLTPQELINDLDYCFMNFDRIISKYRIEKIKTIGDAYMCAGGLPIANNTNPVDVVKAGLEIQDFMQNLKQEKLAENRPFFELRVGINTGPLVAGIVGIKKFQYDIWGDTVNIASRLESSGEIGKVNISQMTYEKVKHQFNCVHRGKIEAKNKGAIDMYFVQGYKIEEKE